MPLVLVVTLQFCAGCSSDNKMELIVYCRQWNLFSSHC